VKVYPFTFSINDSKYLVNEKTLDLSPYRITGICGPIGSGKSTFIKLLVDYTYRDLKIFSSYGFSAYLSQDLTRLFTGNTVNSLISLYQDDRFEVGRHFQKESFKRYLNTLEFPQQERYDEYLTDFSEGERQRLAIALTAATSAETAVFDEPTTALNNEYRQRFYSIVKEISHNTRVFIISHRINDIISLCDSVLWFNRLKITEAGPLEYMIRYPELVRHYLNVKMLKG